MIENLIKEVENYAYEENKDTAAYKKWAKKGIEDMSIPELLCILLTNDGKGNKAQKDAMVGILKRSVSLEPFEER